MKRNFKRNFVKNGSGGGPLLNDPTTNLQDLDRELELLRRKRQILESQQQQYQTGFNRPSPWEQPPSINQYSSPSQGFNQPRYAGLYDSAQPKPAAIWQEPQAKRFRHEYGAGRLAQPQRPQNFGPPKAYHQTKPSGAGGPKRPKGFKNPNPLPKPAPKPAAAPKRANVSVQKPKPTAPAATPTQRYNKDAKPSRFIDYIVMSDESLPPVVKGRLECVVGDLFRGLKERSGDNPDLLSPERSKHVKQVLRDRIRKVMLGKAVGAPDNVAALYAKAYPENDDEEIFRLAKEINASSSVDKEKCITGVETEKNPFLQNLVATTGSPEFFFMKNVEKIIGLKVEEIFEKLQKVYEEDDGSVHELIKEVDKISKQDTEGVEPEGTTTSDGVVKNESSEDNADDGKAKKEEKASEAVANEDKSREEYYSKLMQALIRRELPKVLPDYKNLIIKLLHMDNHYLNAQKMLASKATSVHALGKKPEYFVMVLGEPNLPYKDKLQVFLNKFSPASIQKHKRVRNVLYVGFSDKKNFHEIIANDGFVLTDMKLSIKESKSYHDNPLKIVQGIAKLIDEKTENTTANAPKNKETVENKSAVSQTKVEPKENGASKQAEVKAEDKVDSLNTSESAEKESSEDDKILFDSDLDGQINDLISSIKNSNDFTTKNIETMEPMQVDEVKDSLEKVNGENEPAESAEADNASEGVKADNVTEKVEATDVVTEQTEAKEAITEEPEATVPPTKVVEGYNEVETPATANIDDKAPEPSEESEEAKDSVEVVKTPTRASTRLAGGVKTRRASRLAQ